MAAGGSRWLVWFGAAAALAAMLIFSLVLRVQENDEKAWPIARAVAARLATDDGARDLYAKNPRLGDSYATADAFVAAISAQRGAFGALPARHPGEDSFQSSSDPESLRVLAKGSGGAWMEFQVERSDGSAAGHAAIGEGITFLGLAADRDTLRETLHLAYNEIQWTKFKAVEQALLTDEGVQALLQSNPNLAKDGAAKAAFLRQAQAWRPRLAAHQPPATWKAAVDADAKDEMVSMQRRTGGPLGDYLAVSWRLKDQSWLRATWKSGQLSKLALED